MAGASEPRAFRLKRLIRADGPFELWQADDPAAPPSAPTFALRRRATPFADDAATLKNLEESTAVARRVEHENVLHCHGLVEIGGQPTQIEEYAHDVALDGLLKAAQREKAKIDVKLAVWIARQILEAVVHAESLGFAHGNIAPKHAYVTRQGFIKVDFGITRLMETLPDRTALDLGDAAYHLPLVAAGGGKRSEDVYAVAAILWELICGSRYALARKTSAAYVPLASEEKLPATLDVALSRALAPASPELFADAKTFRQALARVFYVDLDADDDKNGARAMRYWTTRILPDFTVANEPLPPGANTHGSAQRPKGTFTKMLEELEAPVKPKDLSPEDYDSGLSEAPDSTWTPGQTIANALIARPGDVSEKRTEAMPEAPLVAVSVPLAARSLSPLPTERMVSDGDAPLGAIRKVSTSRPPALMAPLAPPISSPDARFGAPGTSAPSGPTAPSAPSLSSIEPRPLTYEVITWALIGFALTFFILLMASLLGL